MNKNWTVVTKEKKKRKRKKLKIAKAGNWEMLEMYNPLLKEIGDIARCLNLVKPFQQSSSKFGACYQQKLNW